MESNRVARGNGRVKWNSCEEFYSLGFCSLRAREEASAAPLDLRAPLGSNLSRYFAIAHDRLEHTPGGKFSTRAKTNFTLRRKGKLSEFV